ncbi:MAG: phosphate uptake regulator PhoU [Candidatus Pacearchaeota archaeon]
MVKSEPRKLIKFGNSSYIVSLPKKWIEKNNLKKGDIIYLEDNNDSLTLNLKDKRKPDSKKIVISMNNKDSDELKREFTSAYINNYSEIIIEGKNERKRDELINKIVQEKIGVEIVEQNAEQIVIKDILDLEAISFEKITRRLDNVVRSMFDELITALKSGNLKEWNIKEIQRADYEVNKLYFLVWKLVRKCQDERTALSSMKLSSKDLSDIQWISLHLEYIGDDLKRLARNLAVLKIDAETIKKILLMIQTLEKKYITVMNAYYSLDKLSARKIASSKYEFQKNCDALYLNHPSVSISIEKLKGISSSIHNISKIIAY